jgi:hypothetical protein
MCVCLSMLIPCAKGAVLWGKNVPKKCPIKRLGAGVGIPNLRRQCPPDAIFLAPLAITKRGGSARGGSGNRTPAKKAKNLNPS